MKKEKAINSNLDESDDSIDDKKEEIPSDDKVDQQIILSLADDDNDEEKFVTYQPKWSEDAFVAEFADAFVDHTETFKIKSLTILPSLIFLSKSLKYILNHRTEHEEWIKPINNKQLISLEKMSNVLENAISLCKAFPLGAESEEEFHKFLTSFVIKIIRMVKDDIMIIPGGWMKSRKKRHGMIYVLQRTHYGWNFTIVNLGEGLEYHPVSADYSPKIKRKACITFKDIPFDRLSDSNFWFFLFRMQVWPSKSHNAEKLYCHLAPILNSKPLFANINYDDDLIKWKSLPRAPKETSLYKCVKESFFFSLRSLEFSKGHTKYIGLLLRWSSCQLVLNDLRRAISIRGSEMHLIKIACHQLAHHASKQAKKYKVLQDYHLRSIQRIIGEIHKHVAQVYKAKSTALPPELNLENNGFVWKSRPFPLFDRFHSKIDVNELAGSASKSPLMRPIEMTLVPDTVNNPYEIALALRHCDHLCTLMSYQSGHIKNTYTLRLSLIQYIFTSVLPIPLPYKHAKKSQCIYVQPMRYETQIDILRSIAMITRHFSACAFSVPIDRSFDARRILTMACISSITDAVMRVIASDIPSEFCKHYSGQAIGPAYPFGFDIGYFEIQSSLMEISDPRLIAARTQVLDYFTILKSIVHDDHIIFDFEFSNQIGNLKKLFEQLCYEIGFPNYRLELYLCSKQSQILDFYPELLYFRDIIYMFKYMLNPNVDVFPEIRPWNQMDAKLHWTYDKEKGYIIKGFKRILKCLPSEKSKLERQRKIERKNGLFSGLIGSLTRLFSSEISRAPPSPSDPSILVHDTEINNEDDVLHIKKLPDFDHRLSQKNSEALLSFLTVPYIRIPLIMNFFSTEDKIKSLRSSSLRAVLDAVLFEPNHWQAPKRDH